MELEPVEIHEATFPEALPHPESHVIVINCGNSRLNFCYMREGRFRALWSTPHVPYETEEDLERVIAEPVEILSKHFPAPIFNEAFSTHFRSRRIPVVTCYLSSSNDAAMGVIVKLLGGVMPVRFYRLVNDNFFADLPYPTVGVDRCAAAYAAKKQVDQGPVLVIDGGTALTWTILEDGAVQGGGIAVGLLAKARALFERTQLPSIGPEDILKWLKELEDPFDVAGVGTEENMIQGILRETFGLLSNVIQCWIEDCGPNRSIYRIFMTGGDGEIYQNLLENATRIFGPAAASLHPRIELTFEKNFLLKGVQLMLEDHASAVEETTDVEMRRQTVGQRVAKYFNPEEGGSPRLYRGTIESLVGKTLETAKYYVFYDDGDMEQLEMNEMLDAMNLYIAEGEDDPDENLELDKVEEAKFTLKALGQMIGSSTERPTKKARTEQLEEEAAGDQDGDNENFIGRRLCKYLGSMLYFGSVTSVEADGYDDEDAVYNVLYDDGDTEGYNIDELCQLLNLYEENQRDDPNVNGTAPHDL